MQKRSGLLGLATATFALASCSTHGPYQIEGVGVGSECNFTGEFADTFPCEGWTGTSPSPYAVTEVLWHPEQGSVVLGFASTKPIQSVEGEIILSSQIDGTLGMVRLSTNEKESSIVIKATDGSESKCRIAPNFGESFKCEDW